MAQAVVGLRRFPRGLSQLVGREREVAELREFVLGSPLVTVTGPGGVGKTRLALEVARTVAGEFPDGVHFVELGSVTEPGRVAAEVATALGVQQVPGAAYEETLAAALAPRLLLLVLDNCEQVAAAVAELCAALLRAADDLHVLATSREQLWVAEEVRYRLSPLSLPASGEMVEAGQSAAVALFAERARLVAPGFALTEASAPLAARVVTRLDGMPLAIELAAARVEALGLPGLADRIDGALGLLEGRDAGTAARHRSLAAVAEWSYRLLPVNGQRVFRRLAVFPGPFTLEGAEAVAGPGAGAVVLLLVDCSLVSPPQAGSDGRMRYSLLHTLRDYGRGLLAGAGEEATAMAALTAFGLAITGEAAAGLATNGDDRELAALRYLDAEDATLAAALDWALGHDAETALRLAVALAPWRYARGPAEGYAWLTAAVRVQGDGPAAVGAHLWLGILARALGDDAGGIAHYSAACESVGASLTRPAILALAGRSVARNNMSQRAEAAADAERALELARQSGDRVALVRALEVRGINEYYAKNGHGALTWAQQAADGLTAEIPGYLARQVRSMLVNVLIMVGRYDDARELCADGLAWCRNAGDLAGLSDLLASCIYLENKAYLEGQDGNLEAMAAYLHEAVGVGLQTGSRSKLRYCVMEGGELCMLTGRWAEAATLWAAGLAEVERTGAHGTGNDPRYPEFIRHIETMIGPKRLRAAQERGTRMTITAAAEFVVLLTEPTDPPHSYPDPASWASVSLRPGSSDVTPVITAPVNFEPAASVPATPASLNPVQPTPVLSVPGASDGGELTPRERELVTLVAQGRTNAEIAGQLFISVSTVASHLDRIRSKTGARRRADLTRLALQESLV